MFISTVVCLVPVVDCSEAVGVVEMTEVTVTFFIFLVAYINFYCNDVTSCSFLLTCFDIIL